MEGTIIEVCAAVAGLFYLYYAIRERPICWGFYFVSAFAYLPVFAKAGLLYYALFQVLYMIGALMGLFLWRSSDSAAKIRKLSTRENLLIISLSSIVYYVALKLLPGNAVTPADLLLSVFTVTGTLLTTMKYLDSWTYWKGVNAFAVLVALFSQLYPTVIFFLVNFIFSFAGYDQWRMIWLNQRRVD